MKILYILKCFVCWMSISIPHCIRFNLYVNRYTPSVSLSPTIHWKTLTYVDPSANISFGLEYWAFPLIPLMVKQNKNIKKQQIEIHCEFSTSHLRVYVKLFFVSFLYNFVCSFIYFLFNTFNTGGPMALYTQYNWVLG